jgi:hypothetical protein
MTTHWTDLKEPCRLVKTGRLKAKLRIFRASLERRLEANKRPQINRAELRARLSQLKNQGGIQ